MTYDELLTMHIGQFGPGQWLSLLWASLSEIANAAAFFVWVFITVKPASSHSWGCTDTADAVCAAAVREGSSTTESLCSLSADQWHWTNQGVQNVLATGLNARFYLPVCVSCLYCVAASPGSVHLKGVVQFA